MDTAFLDEEGAAAPSAKAAGGATAWWRQPRGVAFIVVVVTALSIGLGVGLGVGAEGGAGGGSTPTMQPLPVVVSTWFAPAVQTAYDLLAQGYTALDAAELGCTYCEDARCDGTVGWGGSPDTNGETTLDAMIMDAETHTMGAVSYLRRVRHAIAAARKVMTYTEHTVLAGDGATNFSVLAMGLPEQDLTSDQSRWIQGNWTANKCQPNAYWNAATVPASATGCGPYPVPVTPSYTPVYTPLPAAAAAAAATRASGAAAAADRLPTASLPKQRSRRNPAGRTDDHDTIGMCTLDLGGKMAAG
jgi:isoaspartyl peptidase/L-asparaginase-like protein (Ntn-hydrolase superfamily)